MVAGGCCHLSQATRTFVSGMQVWHAISYDERYVDIRNLAFAGLEIFTLFRCEPSIMSCVIAIGAACLSQQTAVDECLANVDSSCSNCFTDACNSLFPNLFDLTSCEAVSTNVCDALTTQYDGSCACTENGGGCEQELDDYFGCVLMDSTGGDLGCSSDFCCLAEPLDQCSESCPTGTVILGFCIEDCFSAANWVEVQGRGDVPIGELRVGDFVRDVNGAYTQVYSLAHWDHTARVDYLQITADKLEHPLEVSGSHLLYVNGTLLPASSVTPGDWLGEESNSVTKIATVHSWGRYAPLTMSGTLQVNHVPASNYVDLTRYAPWHSASGDFYHTVSHGYMAPLRWACRWDFRYCQDHEEQHSLGYSPWLFNTVSVYVRFVQPLPKSVQMGMAALVSPVWFLTGSSMGGPLVMALVSILVLRRWSVASPKRSSHP